MRRALALLVLVVALAAAGCGGGGGEDGGSSKAVSKSEYGKQLAQTGRALQQTFADISDQTQANTSSKQLGQRLEKGAGALDATIARFAAITPPADLENAHTKLVAGLEEVATMLHQGASAAAKGDEAALTKALRRLATSDGVTKITEARQELTAKGVTTTTPK